ncbi:MAG TPA: THUMP domain-containing protein, partial [Gemmataceae bacterium]|nr:THUMP domain-containing protein [Gemmataceae bacterium]
TPLPRGERGTRREAASEQMGEQAVSQARYFATCGRGIEPVLADELRALGAADVAAGRGGVAFAGDRVLLYRANLWLRTAVRVLRPLLEAPVTSPDELYDAVRGLDWSRYLTPEHTLAVDCNVRDSHITHSKYAALRVKDAICDQFLERTGRRPSVDVEEPMVKLNLHVYRDEAVLSLDSSGDSLHKRGYRPIQTRAPLNEALAAALVLLTGWIGAVPFADPLCGSGTLPIEACWIALRRPPGLTRRRFGFMGWMDFDIALWAELRDEARRGVLKRLPAPVLGSDVRRDAIAFAQANARAAGIGHLPRFEVRDVRDFRPPEGPPGVIVCNPPYGERIGEEKELRGLYRTLGEVFRERCAGWTAYVFTGNARLARQIGLEPTRQVPLFNGKIPCRLLQFDLG